MLKHQLGLQQTPTPRHACHNQGVLVTQRRWMAELFPNTLLHTYIAEKEPALLPALTCSLQRQCLRNYWNQAPIRRWRMYCGDGMKGTKKNRHS